MNIKATDPSVQVLITIETYRKMLLFANQEKADMHFIYRTANGNSAEARRLYGEKFPNKRLHNDKTFARLHRQLCETRSFCGEHSNAGRAKSNRTIAVEDKILDMVAEHPNASTRTVACQIEESPSTTWGVLKAWYSMHPFHVQRVQVLT